MSPAHFAAWISHMGWSDRKCARELGCSQNSVAAWRKAGAPRYIALACAALAFGLPEWRQP
jgi:hypothetical protein